MKPILSALFLTTFLAGSASADDDALQVEDARTLRRVFEKSLADAAGDPEAQLRLADWAMRKRLFTEALDLADQALLAADRADPEHKDLPQLPASLFDAPVLFDGDDALAPVDDLTAWRLLAMTSGRQPARAQVAAARLAELVLLHDMSATLLRGLRDVDEDVRVASLGLLARATPDGTLDEVIGCMLFDREPAVRRAAMLAAKAYENDGIIHPLVRGLQQGDERLRLASMDAIEFFGDDRAVAALIANLRRAAGGVVRNNLSVTTQTSIVKDFDVEIAQAAVIAQPIVDVITSGSILDVGVAGVHAKAIGPEESARVGRVLAYLTGQDYGTDAARWEEWFNSQRGR